MSPFDRPDVRHPKLNRLYDYWAGKTSPGRLPARADIDPLEMREWLGNLLLIEVAGKEFRYRLYGTEFVERFGREMTGRTIAELPAAQHRLLEAEYESACRAAHPIARIYTAQFEPSGPLLPGERPPTNSWERLVLPLASDGTTIDMLLIGAYQLD